MNRKPETGVLSIRLRKVDREWLAEEAKRSGVPLSELAFNLICQSIEARGRAESPGIQPAANQLPQVLTKGL